MNIMWENFYKPHVIRILIQKKKCNEETQILYDNTVTAFQKITIIQLQNFLDLDHESWNQ